MLGGKTFDRAIEFSTDLRIYVGGRLKYLYIDTCVRSAPAVLDILSAAMRRNLIKFCGGNYFIPA